MLIVTGDSATGTADDAAAARDKGNFDRSEQMMSQLPWTNANLAPVEMSVADAIATGPGLSTRSPNVAPSNRISS